MPGHFDRLDLNLLRVFDATMAEGSVTRAAQRLSITQPAASHALRRLRESLGGEPLFTRTATGLEPTPRAHVLWPLVRESLSRLRNALAPAAFDPDRDEATYRLTMADATSAVVAPLLARWFAGNPRLSARIRTLASRDPGPVLQSDEIDLAIGYFPQRMVAIDADPQQSPLRHARLYSTRYVCVMRKDHPQAAQPLTLDAFCTLPQALVSFPAEPHGLIDEVLWTMGRARRIVLSGSSFFVAAHTAAHSDLLTVLPAGFALAAGYGAVLVERPLPLTIAPVHVELVWHLRRDADPAQRWLRERLLEASREPMGPQGVWAA